MKLTTTLVLVIASVLTFHAQTRINWDILADVQFVNEYDPNFGSTQSIPRFGEDPEKYERQEVELTGYTIPIDGTGTYYVLSKFPYANCYFCGNAGPETIVELDLKKGEKRRFETDERVIVRGVLELNESDVYRLPYILSEAVVEKLD
ncbi:MAG: hypothetical protein AAGI23_09100 [Bacteroidota bacterium]